MRTALAFALTLALLPLGASARGPRTEPINNPTIPLETKASAGQVKKAVKLAILNRGWTITNESGNSFDATYTRAIRRDDVTAKVHVTYDTKQVKIKYVKSEGLSAEGNNIHPTYNKWMTMLERDIPIYLEREVTASE